MNFDESINKTITIVSIYTIIILILSTLGCASVPLASKDDDLAAKQFRPPVDKSYIYVMRQGRFAGHAAVMTVQLDNKDIAHLANDQYVLLEVDPGKYSIRVSFFRGEYYNQSSVIDLDTILGKMYFLKAKLIFNDQTEFRQLTKEQGKKELVESYSRVNLIENEKGIK